jgi:hypothetical protein
MRTLQRLQDALQEASTMHALVASAAATRLLLHQNLTAVHAPLMATGETLSCAWLRQAHNLVQTRLCEGLVSSWVALAALLILLGLVLVLEAMHASALVGPRPRGFSGLLCDLLGSYCARPKRMVAPRATPKDMPPMPPMPPPKPPPKAAWELALEEAEAKTEALSQVKAVRHLQREHKRQAKPPVAARDFASAFVNARLNARADEDSSPRKIAWGAKQPATRAGVVGCFED